MGKVQKISKGKSYLQLIDEDEPTQPEPEHQGEGEEYDVERAIQMSFESFQAQSQAHVGGVAIQEPIAKATRPLPMVEGKGKAIATEEQATQSLLALYTPKKRSTTDQFIFQRRTPATKEALTGPSERPQDNASSNIVRESPSPADAKTGADTDKTNSGEEKTVKIDEDQAGSDPGKTPESRPPPDDDKMDEDQAGPDPGEIRVALAGPNPKPTHDEFMANVYLNVHESLKFPADEHIILEDPLSSTGTLSSMKNLDDAYTIRDHSLIPPLSTSMIDLSPPKPVPSTTQAPIFTATTATTTKTTLPLPLQQQSTIDSKLVARVTTLENKFSNFEQKSNTLDNTTQNLGSRVFTLELRDLPHKINQTVNEVVKEAVHVALQAPLRDRFRELPEADMKEILHQRMFESGTYKLLHEHVALYEALEASMERANKDEFLAEKDKSSKRRRDDQDPPPPLPDSDLIDLANPEGQRIVPGVSKPLPLGGLPGQVTIQSQFFFNKDLDYLVSRSKERISSVSISKLKAANYPDFGLEELVPSLWIESERDYDISVLLMVFLTGSLSATKFYITRHSVPFDRNKVRSHMWILSVVSLKTLERYGYTYLKEIVLRRVDYKEYKILEVDFKNLHPNDFKDLYLLHLQGQLNHLSGADKVHLFNSVNLWIRNIVIRKQDYTMVSKPRAVIYKDINDQKKMMRETEVHKFSDGMLNMILDKLDHMVKDFKLFKFNPGMETRI
ncbi:hypothetical protein Tco_1271456 [Tanacetum coccineum]